MSDQPLFSPRLLGLWIALGVITFGLTLWFMGQQDGEATVEPSTYSHSAIGHAGIAAILEALDVPVVRSRSDSLHRVRGQGVLVLAEPEIHMPSDGKFEALLHAKTVLVVLPKWLGRPDRGHDGWIDRAVPIGLSIVEPALTRALHDGTIVTAEETPSWSRNELGAEPHFAAPVQLMKSDRLKPIVAAETGILLGELIEDGRKIWVLSDPDVIANHGLALGNAEFAVALFQRLRGHGNVVFDESIHGFEPVPRNPFDLVLRKRFVPMTLEILAAMLLLLWATIGRFGAPETAPLQLLPGKQSLIRNVAELLDYAGYQRILVRRYVEATIRNAALQLHAPRGLDGAAGLDWLQKLSVARGGTIDAVAISREAAVLAVAGKPDFAALFRVARAIRQWKQEMMDGPSGGTQHRGGHTRRSPQGGNRPG